MLFVSAQLFQLGGFFFACFIGPGGREIADDGREATVNVTVYLTRLDDLDGGCQLVK